ncbi:retrovirus-related pol polyprotein from transposon TNT 1-94 [Tanacetum coccineum]
MSKSTKPYPSFYNNDFYDLVYLSTEEKYTTSLTKHYDERYHIQGIEDIVSDIWSKEDKCYQIEALNGIHHWEDARQDFKASINNITLGKVYTDMKIIYVSYQKSLNLTKPKLYCEGIDDKIPYTMSEIEKGVVYLNQHNRRSLMKLNEVHKFCDGTLIKVQENLIDMIGQLMKHREQLRRLEEYVGGRPKTIDPRSFVRPMAVDRRIKLAVGNTIAASTVLNGGLALLDFRAGLSRDPYGACISWNPDDLDPCSWANVHCVDGNVQVLDLKGLSLEGVLSPEIGNLKHLRRL